MNQTKVYIKSKDLQIPLGSPRRGSEIIINTNVLVWP